MISHSPDQPKQTTLHFFLLFYTEMQTKNTVVYSSLADIGSHPSLIFETAQDSDLYKWYHSAHWEGTENMNCNPLSTPKGQNWNSKWSTLPPDADNGIIGIYRIRLLRAQRHGEFCLPITHSVLRNQTINEFQKDLIWML